MLAYDEQFEVLRSELDVRHVEMAGILQHTKQQNFIVSTHSRHRRRKETEEKAKVVPVI